MTEILFIYFLKIVGEFGRAKIWNFLGTNMHDKLNFELFFHCKLS
jgi:hypothetical protein